MVISRKIFIISLILVFVGVLSACSSAERGNSGYYLVDPRFSDLYEHLQGEDVLGPPISGKKYVAGTNLEKQYFEGAVLVFDPDHSPRYYLDPVGLDAGFSDLPNNMPENPGVRYLNGFIIPPDFTQFYDQMGGERWVGLPLTRARLNPDKDRIEQYFENMGFFRFEDDPPGTVYLMPYGLWKCAGECSQYPGVQNAGFSSSKLEEVKSPFGEAISRFGTQFTGQTVTGAYQSEDGSIEQVFQNVVLYQDPASPLGVSLRPLSSLLEQGSGQLQSREDGVEGYFREVQDNQGYYIPAYFMDFINRYFGFEISGEPISRLEEIRTGVAQQCFQNYCLLYDAKADPSQQVRLLPQGQKYRDTFYETARAAQSEPVIAERHIQLDIWEQLPQISSQETQQIGACIHDQGIPLVNAQAVVYISTEGGSTHTYPFDLTDSGGCAFLTLDSIQAPNGTAVDYKVCFQGVGDGEYCKRDSYLIWGNPEEQLGVTSVVEQPAGSVQEIAPELDVWELFPQLSSTDSQEVGACVHKGDQPQPNMESRLILETPRDGVIFYDGGPSDQGGCAFFKLSPVEANNGETIPYQVCFINKYGEQFCEKDSFLIWGAP